MDNPGVICLTGAVQVPFHSILSYPTLPNSTKTSPTLSQVMRRPSGQCMCQTEQTFYPVGVETLDVWFEHAYDTTEKVPLLH